MGLMSIPRLITNPPGLEYRDQRNPPVDRLP
jgi:hypothetical protein